MKSKQLLAIAIALAAITFMVWRGGVDGTPENLIFYVIFSIPIVIVAYGVGFRDWQI